MLLIACFVRAFLPCDGGRIDVARAARAGSAPVFRCEGHDCCCETIEQCAASCCCFPEAEGEREPAVATLTPHGARESRPVIEASRCGGELPNPAVVTFTGIVAITPVRVRVVHAPPPPARLLFAELTPHTTRRPSPEAPPPRLLSHVL